ncbi:lysophospholipase [Oscillochloris sp. ZM17-4]|uniref:alpha/beta hydrolase n=1 Tax=Oscillochloris sp. ZM17-4 TaxID=2866714 RepID=UPI001C739CFD|nr:alpha/beta fold hydrolase [Oscillochloris sp. ZM17-4]MBX0330059.1 lysophospholipase [Oscillochloris sp. ZM17-4]
MRHLLTSLAIWLGALDTLADRAGLRGLSWGGGALGPLLSLAAMRGRPRAWALLAALPLALPLQLGLASLARPRLNPKRQLLPGDYGDRTVQQPAIPARYGPVPALLIAPKGGARAAVCVAHGSGCDKTFYAWRLADALVGRGLAALLIDLDGHGESPRPQAFPDIIESVAGPARWLRERYERVGLLGMSLGGAVTARAVAEGAPCDALALWEAPPRLRLDGEAYRWVQIAEALRVARPPLLDLFRDGTLYHIIMAWRTSGIRARIGTWDLFDALDLLGSLGRAGSAEGRPPLLLVYGGRDAVLHRGADEEVRAATAGWGTFHLLPRATHLSLPIEPETIAITAAWLKLMLNAEC